MLLLLPPLTPRTKLQKPLDCKTRTALYVEGLASQLVSYNVQHRFRKASLGCRRTGRAFCSDFLVWADTVAVRWCQQLQLLCERFRVVVNR